MGSLFRSEKMSLVQLFIQYEVAKVLVTELGELGIIQFCDLNPKTNSFQRNFVNEIKRYDEMERKLRFLYQHIENAGLQIIEHSERRQRISLFQEMDELEMTLKNYEDEITQLSKSEEAMLANIFELTELKYVLIETERLLDNKLMNSKDEETPRRSLDSYFRSDDDLEMEELIKKEEKPNTFKINFVTGVIPRKKQGPFERVLWRSLRGNLFMNQSEVKETIKNHLTRESFEFNVFAIFCQGEEIKNKIKKICESFGASLYPCPDTYQGRADLLKEISERLQDLENVLSKTMDHRRRLLNDISKQVHGWKISIRKEKMVYFTMSLFNMDVTSKCFVAEGWCSTKDVPQIRRTLNYVTEHTQTHIPSVLNVLKTKMNPPTYHQTNKFTEGFQAIIDAYGVSKYQEVNPTPFAIITFPFLFAVMFGDIGHGILMTLAAVHICIKENYFQKRKDLGEMFEIVFSGRYIILLMGIFSIYTGLIYNDMFSKALPIFDSGWEFKETSINGNYIGIFNGKVYPLGIDFSWHGSDNALIFLNSYKMKMSIIFGVMQMTFGVVLSFYNFQHFRQKVNIINEFIPQIIFLESIFGYIMLTIIYKWCRNWDHRNPPSLLNMLINMFLSPGNIESGEELYSGQGGIQLFLLFLALIAVPWMLLVKPFWIRHQLKKKAHLLGRLDQSIDDEDEDVTLEDEEEHDFGEIMIHQVIHTIEFCLGAISNTASYLRLWALSLAHAQLSSVIWDMTLGKVLESNDGGFLSALGMVGAFATWFVLTISILLIMEGLSAFLHALRLHWVEFNGKFYAGTGYLFKPLSFKNLDNEEFKINE